MRNDEELRTIISDSQILGITFPKLRKNQGARKLVTISSKSKFAIYISNRLDHNESVLP